MLFVGLILSNISSILPLLCYKISGLVFKSIQNAFEVYSMIGMNQPQNNFSRIVQSVLEFKPHQKSLGICWLILKFQRNASAHNESSQIITIIIVILFQPIVFKQF